MRYIKIIAITETSSNKILSDEEIITTWLESILLILYKILIEHNYINYIIFCKYILLLCLLLVYNFIFITIGGTWSESI